jgi:uncharacterized protein (DUF1330 family)
VTTNPTGDQIARLVRDSERLDGEVVMLNLLKFKERADSEGGGTGAESYARYAELAIRKVAERGGKVVWMGAPDQVVIGDDAADDWDAVVLVSYPSRAAFLDMVNDPEYQTGHGDREGGVERMALIAMTPGDGFSAREA